MAKRDILKEAIADAKTVKETAIANAKAALEEAFTPQLKSMLATKLEEMELEEEEEKVNEMADSKYEEDDKVKEGMDSRYEEDDKVKESKEAEREMEEGMSYSSYEEDDDRSMEEDLDEEINLDEILAEIELDEEKKEEDLKEDEKTRAEEEGYLDGEEDADKDMEDKEDKEIDLEDMTDEDLKDFIEDVIADMVASGDLEAGENFEEEGEEEVVDDTEVDVEISEAKKKDKDEEEKETKKEKVDEAEIAEIYKEVERLRESNKALKSELNKSFSTVDTLQEDLNEVNLLNAKLLYTNKIFKAKTLTESQKVKVLGAFDKAGTVKETKLVFETLNDGLKSKKSPITESLGAASRVSRSVNAKKPIIETDPMVERFKKLAGLK
jgi:hypothetical protein